MNYNKIAIHSVPRSGSSWLGAICDSNPYSLYKYQPLFSYALKGYLTETSSITEINDFFLNFLKSQDKFQDQLQEKETGKIPDFKKLEIKNLIYKEVRYHNIIPNLLAKDNEIKIIGLIRNPFGVINSWLQAPKEFKSELNWEIEKEWRFAPLKNLNKSEEFNGYEKWKEVAFLFLKLQKDYPERFYLIQYKNLLSNLLTEVESLFEFVGLELTPQTMDFIRESQSKNDPDSYSVFKQKSKDKAWEKELPSYIIDEIKQDQEFQLLNKHFNWVKEE